MIKRVVACTLSMPAVMLLLAGCSEQAGGTNNGRDNLIPAVEAVQSRQGSLPLVERLSGVVEARNQVEIYPEISATIQAVYVQDGDNVVRHEPLVKLRDREFQERLKQAQAAHQIAAAQARQAEARLKAAQSALKRMQALADKELASDAELEASETQALSAQADVELAVARVDQAQATVAEREEALYRTVIRAPVAGTIGSRNAEVGMSVSSSTRLFTLGQLDSVRVEVILTDRMLDYIEPGQRVDIRSASLPNGVTTASLSRISPFLHPVTHSTEAEIDLANPDHDLKSGMFTTVDIYYGESEQATLIPLSAIYENPLTGGTGVYVSRDSLSPMLVESPETGGVGDLADPVSFEFVPIEVVATGRMIAGVRGVDPDTWVVTIGQDLFGGQSGKARVRPIDWTRVEFLQSLQREDLMDDLMNKQESTGKGTSAKGI